MTAVKASRTSLRAVSQWQDPERVEKLVELANMGMKLGEIAKALDTTAACVKGKLEAMGFKKATVARLKGKNYMSAVSDAGNAAQIRIRERREESGNMPPLRKFSWQEEGFEG